MFAKSDFLAQPGLTIDRTIDTDNPTIVTKLHSQIIKKHTITLVYGFYSENGLHRLDDDFPVE